MKKILSVIFVCLLIAGNVAALSIGDEAPPINAKEWLNASGPVALDQFKDKVVIVEFWATWCPPCIRAIPHLVKLYNKDKAKGLVVIGLTNEKKEAAKIDKFIKKMKMSYIVGTGSTSGSEYGVRGIPHAFVIVDGKVAWQGHPSNPEDTLDQAVEKAFASKVSKTEPASDKKPEKAEKKIDKKVELKKE